MKECAATHEFIDHMGIKEVVGCVENRLPDHELHRGHLVSGRQATWHEAYADSPTRLDKPRLPSTMRKSEPKTRLSPVLSVIVARVLGVAAVLLVVLNGRDDAYEPIMVPVIFVVGVALLLWPSRMIRAMFEGDWIEDDPRG